MKIVSVSIVRGDGYAHQMGLKPHDLIYRINGAAVETPQAVTDSIALGPSEFTIIRDDEILQFNIDSSSLGVVLNEIEFDEQRWLERQAISAVCLTTAQNFSDKRIVRTLDVVGAQCIYGVNAFADLAAAVREFVGGRSQGLQKKVAEARREVCRELRIEAHMLGANAVIAVAFEHTEIGDKGGYMLMVTGTGTAVVVE
jgi:uncharacterized protein YbjQ (UPF0145 family)